MVVGTTNISGKRQQLPVLLFPARKSALLLLVGCVQRSLLQASALIYPPQTGLLRGSVKVKDA